MLLLAALILGGCASIVHSGNRTIKIATEPAGAKATISRDDDMPVFANTTPCIVSLDPKRGYFKGQAYRLKLELAGYRTVELELKPTLSGWYWGNIVFGGLIGMVIVDPITGSMWNLEPDKIEQKLTASQAQLIKQRQGFVVILASQLTPGERAHLIRIN
jgi:hypothetical protein